MPFFIVLASISPVYAQSSFYDVNKIQRIEIEFDQTNWDYILDTAKAGSDGYTNARRVIINSREYLNVGVKYKGNSSYDSTKNKNPLHISLDEYSDQEHEGISSIKLANCHSDPSMIREVFAYSILRNYMHCPRANFATVYVNGEYLGFYTNTESINSQFCSSRFQSAGGTLVSCTPTVKPGPTTKCNLGFLGSDSASYTKLYELKSDYGWQDFIRLCKAIGAGSTNIDSLLDIDAVLWMLAFNSCYANLDSYSGAFCQNYYLYRDASGRFQPIVWDLNMCFGGFPFAGGANSSLSSRTVDELVRLSLDLHAGDTAYPLIRLIFSSPVLKKQYFAHLTTLYSEQQANTNVIDTLRSLVNSVAKGDRNKQFSNSDFDSSLTKDISVGNYKIPGLRSFYDNRNAFVLSQLSKMKKPPTLKPLALSPSQPAMNDSLTVSVLIKSEQPVRLVRFHYRSSLRHPYSSLEMFDSGRDGDSKAGDSIFSVRVLIQSPTTYYYFYAEADSSASYYPEGASFRYFTVNANNSNSSSKALVINECMASNKHTAMNLEGKYADWIELYNKSDLQLSLDNFSLSDDPSLPGKSPFPTGWVVAPHSYQIVWADGKSSSATELHAGFKLSASGESVVLSYNNRIIDSTIFLEQVSDISVARVPNGTGPFVNSFPTFGSENQLDNTIDDDDAVLVEAEPNLCSDFVTIKIVNSIRNSLRIYNASGRSIYTHDGTATAAIRLSDWPIGMYFARCGNSVAPFTISR